MDAKERKVARGSTEWRTWPWAWYCKASTKLQKEAEPGMKVEIWNWLLATSVVLLATLHDRWAWIWRVLISGKHAVNYTWIAIIQTRSRLFWFFRHTIVHELVLWFSDIANVQSRVKLEIIQISLWHRQRTAFSRDPKVSDSAILTSLQPLRMLLNESLYMRLEKPSHQYWPLNRWHS